MRISDWSSDVCSSDLSRVFRSNVFSYASLASAQPVRVFVGGFVHRPGAYAGTSMDSILHYIDQAGGIDPDRGSFLDIEVRSEEHTSELQSLMRISYAVFCLKKKTQKKIL